MYCTNCGEKIGFKKICKKCGHKMGKENNYCVYCGNKIDKDAEICLKCNQKKYKSKFNYVRYILFTIFILISLFGFYSYLYERTFSNLIIVIGFFIIALNFLPLWKNIINVKFSNNKVLRKVLISIKTLLIPVIAISFIIYGSITAPYDWTAEDASNYAVTTYFNTQLKNPDSLQIHNYSVTYSKNKIDNKITVWVKYDYSAQNGFGGYNRDSITVTLLYDTENGVFSFVSAQ